MLRFVASFITSNTKPTTDISNIYEEEPAFNAKNDVFLLTREEYSKVTSDDEEQPEEELDIQSLRQQKLRELAQKALLRKLSRQAVMNRYNRDHLPLSQIQEELKDDDVPLQELQDKLKQKENISIYTTIRENLNFLLYSKSSKPKKSRPTLSTFITNHANDDIPNTNNVPIPRDSRDYDVWDDAIIGRLMNLVDTIGVEDIQEETSEGPVKDTTLKINNELIDKVVEQVIKEAMEGMEGPNNESLGVPKERNFTFSTDIERIFAESSAAVAIGNNVMKNVENNATRDIKNIVVKDVENNATRDIKNIVVKDVGNNATKDVANDVENNAANDVENNAANDVENNAAKDIGNNVVENVESNIVKDVENNIVEDVENNIVEDVENNVVEDVENNIMEDVENETMEDLQENIQEEMKSESTKIAEEIINFGETVNVAESLLLSDNLKNDGEILTSTKSIKRGNRYRRSIFSLGQFPPPKSLKRSVSDLNRKSSIHSKMSYENDISRRSSVSSKFSVNTNTSVINEDDSDNIKFYKKASLNNKSLRFLKKMWKNNHNEEFTGKYYKQGVGFESENESRRNSRVEGPKTIGFAGANPNRSDPDYSNFYLSMPNGKWMVRTRTASRKITGTQYVDKEYI